MVHGLYVDGYGVSTQAEPGRPGELRFVADRSGAFRIRCAVPCGNLHPFMIGKLVVGPNLTWLRAIAATLITAVGALAFFWRALMRYAISEFPVRQAPASQAAGSQWSLTALTLLVLRAGDHRRAVRHAGGQPQLRHRLRLDRLVGAADPAAGAVPGPAVVRRLPHPRAGRVAAAPGALVQPRPGGKLYTRSARSGRGFLRNIWLQNVGFLARGALLGVILTTPVVTALVLLGFHAAWPSAPAWSSSGAPSAATCARSAASSAVQPGGAG